MVEVFQSQVELNDRGGVLANEAGHEKFAFLLVRTKKVLQTKVSFENLKTRSDVDQEVPVGQEMDNLVNFEVPEVSRTVTLFEQRRVTVAKVCRHVSQLLEVVEARVVAEPVDRGRGQQLVLALDRLALERLEVEILVLEAAFLPADLVLSFTGSSEREGIG